MNCRVYWGSHGCQYERGHAGHCTCGCCECSEHVYHAPIDDEGTVCAGAYPYYGPDTMFYGEDVTSRGLPELINE